MPGRQLRTTVAVVSGGHFVSHFYLLALPPLFPLLKPDLGIGNAGAGLLLSVVSVATLLQVPVGEVVDRVGAKRVFVGGVAATAAGIALAGLAPSYELLFVAVAVSGLGQATFHPADYALLDAVTDEAVEGKGFSVHTFGGFLGFGAAPVAVGTLGLAIGWQPALVIAGTAGLGYAALAAVVLEPVYLRRIDERTDDGGPEPDGGADDGPESDGDGAGGPATPRGTDAAPGPGTGDDPSGSLPDWAADLLRPAMIGAFLFFVVLTMADRGIQAFTPVLVAEGLGLGTAVGNLTLTVYFVLASAGILVGGVLADRYPPHRVIAVALCVAAAFAWVLASGLAPATPTAVGALFAALGFAGGLVYPSRDRLVSTAAAAGSTGKSFGFAFTGVSLGGIVAPVLLGTIIDAAGAPPTFLAIGGFMLAAAVVAVLTRTWADG